MKHKIIPSSLLLKLLNDIRLINITLPRRSDLTESLSDVQCSTVTVEYQKQYAFFSDYFSVTSGYKSRRLTMQDILMRAETQLPLRDPKKW